MKTQSKILAQLSTGALLSKKENLKNDIQWYERQIAIVKSQIFCWVYAMYIKNAKKNIQEIDAELALRESKD